MIEEIKAYKVNGKVFETKEEAEREEGLNKLVDKIHYTGIDERGIVDGIIEHKEGLLEILNKYSGCNMENKLFRGRNIREVLLKDGTILKYTGKRSYLQYGVAKEETKESIEWLDLLKELNYHEKFEGNTDRKNRIWVDVEYHDKHYEWQRKKVIKEDFVKVNTTYEIRYYEPKEIRMKEIINELNAEDFILFLKDNEIKYLPKQ